MALGAGITMKGSTDAFLPDEKRATSDIHFRKPRMEDGAVLWEMVRHDGVLDLNSPYFYLTFCQDFAETSLVAEREGRVVGMMLGYRPPGRPNVLFVWQVGVEKANRQQGIAKKLIHEVMKRGCRHEARFLEATVTPSNRASERLFTSIANDLNLPLHKTEHFPATAFPEKGHEPEILFRIGPIHEGLLPIQREPPNHASF